MQERTEDEDTASEDTAKTVACSMVQGRLDYCNAVLYATSAANLHKLQHIQNSLARIVTGIYKHEHSSSQTTLVTGLLPHSI